jgi:DNA-directed RNA polymerase alpha subunit
VRDKYIISVKFKNGSTYSEGTSSILDWDELWSEMLDDRHNYISIGSIDIDGSNSRRKSVIKKDEISCVYVDHRKISEDESIDELGISCRSFNCLNSAGIKTIKDLLQYSEEDLLQIKNYGSASIRKTMQQLQKYGYELKRK